MPVPYFHLVFTLPAALRHMALPNTRAVYAALMQAAAQALLEVTANPLHLGAEIGFLIVLHTWGQNLMNHRHVHCVIPGGGLAPDGAHWIRCRKDFFLPVSVVLGQKLARKQGRGGRLVGGKRDFVGTE